MNLVHDNENLIAYIKAKRPAILIETFEEGRFLEHLTLIAEQRGVSIQMFSPTFGVKDITSDEIVNDGIFDLTSFIDYIMKSTDKAMKSNDAVSSGFYVVPDVHLFWDNPLAVRFIREYIEHREHPVYRPLIFISPVVNIPIEFEKLLAIDTFSLPKREDYEMLYAESEKFLLNNSRDVPDSKGRETILNALKGLTLQEASHSLNKSITKHRGLQVGEIVSEKAQAIKKSGLLEYITNTYPLDNIGGIDLLRDWLRRAKATIEPDAADYLPDPVKGLVLNGFPGTGKSAVVKGIAHEWNLPLVRLNMSDVMDAHVGASEKNISRALRLAESLSPCVLWIDELEKALAGGDSSASTDSGTTSRVINSILTWLSDRESAVFVLATANSLEGVKDELTRAGRFDDIFFVSVPSNNERAEILNIHLKKRNQALADGDLRTVAESMDGFTGAEIEQVVKEGMREAYHVMREQGASVMSLTSDLLIQTASGIIPLSRRKPELLQNLRNWAKTSARCVSSAEKQVVHAGALPPIGERPRQKQQPLDLDLV